MAASLCRIPALTLCILLAAPALAQQPDPNDPTVQAPSTGTVPGRLSRPTNRPDTADPEGENEETDGEEAGQEPAAQQPGTPAPDGERPASTGPPPATRIDPGSVPRGPRVLNVDEIEPDVGEIDGNFEDEFDPLDPPSNVRVNIDFREAELNDVVMWISALTGRNFIIADTINASKKITIISPQPVSIGEAYRAFIAALNMNGLTIVPFGRFLKIVEAGGAERQTLEPSDSMSSIPADDRMVTHIHQLQHVSISTVQSVLDALKTDSASLIPYEPTNTLIITETGSNLRRLLSVLERLDVPSGQEQINIYQVQYAAAEDLKTVLLEIFEQDENAPQPQAERPRRRSRRRSDEAEADAAAEDGGVTAVAVSEIIADDRTNQLIIIANERSYEQILEIIGHLDVPIPGEGQIHVLFLENADATELASTLQSLTQSVEEQREETNVSLARGDSDDSGAPQAAITATFSGDISITADEATNSLVVVASLRDFLALRNVVGQLDRRRQQVYVEAVIMEVSLNRQNQFGIALNGGYLPSIGGEEVPIFGATTVGSLSSVILDPSSLMGLGVGLRGPAIEGTAEALGLPVDLPSFGAVLQALQTDNDVNVLSTPHILTMDNEEAEIVVGENIPFISGISGGLGGLGSLGGLDIEGLAGGLGGFGGGFGGGFPSVAVQRQDVALTLRITPQINESNFVRLEIEEQVEDVQSIDPVLGPRTTTRQARTTVVVQDQQTIVIGGLMRDSVVRDENKIPVLGDIPIIGRLFRNTQTRNTKTNLLLLLTPYIIRDTVDFQAIFRRKMEEREEFIEYFGRRDTEFVRAVDYARKDGPLQSMYELISTEIELEEARRQAFTRPTVEYQVDGPRGTAPLRPAFDQGPSDPSDGEAPSSEPAGLLPEEE